MDMDVTSATWTVSQDTPNLNASLPRKPPYCIYSLFLYDGMLLDQINFIIKVPVMLTLTAFGLAGNTLAYVVLGRELRRSSTSVLLRSLAIADNAVLLIYTFEFTFSIYRHTGLFLEGFIFLQYVAKYTGAVVLFLKSVAVFLIVFVTGERYIAVCKPLKAQSICTVKNTYKAILILYVSMFLFHIPNILQSDLYFARDPCSGVAKPVLLQSKIMQHSVLYKALYVNALDYIVNFLLPAFSMFYMNHYLIKSLKSAISSGMGSNIDQRERQSASLTRRVLVVAIAFVVIELPAFLANLVHLICGETGLNAQAMHYVFSVMVNLYVFATLNSVINFYVYCLTGKSFRKSLYRMFRGGHRAGRSGASSTAVTTVTD